MKKIVMLLGLMVALLGATLVQAQDAETLEYGAEVEGEITDDQFEYQYTFEGTAGDIVVVDVRLAEPGAIGFPNLFLNGPDGSTIAEQSNFYQLGEAMISAELPEDGTYTIIFTRSEGRAGTDVGPFILRLLQPEILEAGATVEGEIDLATGNQYYVVQGAGTLTYAFTDVVDQVAALTLTEVGNFQPSAILSNVGNDITVSANLEGDNTYIAGVVYEQSIAIIYETYETEYTLTFE